MGKNPFDPLAGKFEFVQALLPGCTATAELRPAWTLAEGKFNSSGKWTLAGDHFTLTDNSYHVGCEEDAIYVWSLAEDSLEFDFFEEECTERAVLFRTHPWTKIQ